MKKNTITNLFFGAIMLLVVAAIFLWKSVPEFVVSLKSPVDFTESAELPDAEIKPGIHVKGDIYAILDSFASEQTWTERSDGSRSAKKTSSIYYIIPVGEQSYVGVKAFAADKKTYDALSDATWDWVLGETEYINGEMIPFDGRIVKMEDDLYQYMIEWFQESGYFGEDASEAEIKAYVLPYLFEPFSPGLYTVLTIGAVIILIAAILALVGFNQNKKYKKRMEELANMPAPAYDPTQQSTDALSHLQQ